MPDPSSSVKVTVVPSLALIVLPAIALQAAMPVSRCGTAVAEGAAAAGAGGGGRGRAVPLRQEGNVDLEEEGLRILPCHALRLAS